MAELNENLVYLIVSFFVLTICGYVFMVAINGTFTPMLNNIINSGNLVAMEESSKTDVLNGISNVGTMIKFLLAGLFVCCLIAVTLFIFFKREEENQVV